MDVEAGHNLDILAGKVAHQYPSDRPVDDIHTTDIT